MRRVVWMLASLVVTVAGCGGSGSGDVNGSEVSTSVASTQTSVGTSVDTTSSPPSTSSIVSPVTSVTSTSIVPGSLDAIVAERHGGGSGTVIIGVFDGESASMAAAGVDADGNTVTADRPWPTASLAKLFTAAAVMQLVDGGLVDLDAPVSDYVDFPIWDQITVRHLLQHKSTIPTVASFAVRCPTEGSFEAVEKVVADNKQSVEPGTRDSYSNTNYLVLGLLIGSVSGQDPGHFMRDTIFERLGMDSTYWYESQPGPSPWWPRASSTQGVGLDDCGEFSATFGTDGAAITSTQDMDRFYRGLFGLELFGSETLELMLEMESNLFGFRYGLGVLEMVNESSPDDLLYGFGGDGMTYRTAAFHDPSKGRTVAVFTTVGDQQTLLWEAIAWANEQQG